MQAAMASPDPIQSIQTGGGAIKSHGSEEHFQRFRERGRGIVRQKRTERGQHESNSRRSIGNSPSRQIGDDETRAQVHEDLDNHYSAEIADSKQPEDHRQKSGVTGQALIGRYNVARLRSTVSSVLEPVAGKICVNVGIVRDRWEVHEEDKPQHQTSQKHSYEKPRMSAEQAEHRGNIAFSTWLLALSL